jgi:molecular chaperone GrpE
MRKSTNEQDQPEESHEQPSAQTSEAQPEEDHDMIIVSAPDPDYDADLDDGYAEESGQGRRTIDLDAAMDLESALKAADTSLRKKSVPTPTSNGNGAAQEKVAEPAEASEDGAAVAALRAQLEQERNNTLRAVADLHNFRRRTDEERSRLILDANERLIKEILPVVDDFDRSLAAARQAESYEQLVEGVEAVLRKIGDVLGRQGLEPIPAVGEQFDPTVHEAVMVEEGSDQPDETVIEELRKGYKMNGRVLRPALVKVAKS